MVLSRCCWTARSFFESVQGHVWLPDSAAQATCGFRLQPEAYPGRSDDKDPESREAFMKLRLVCVALSMLVLARPVAAQQRPLVTEDPETIPPGRVLVEGGVDFAHDQEYPVSGLEGNL